jgi:hypothetical protein
MAEEPKKASEQESDEHPSEQGAEAYGGDPDAGPGVTPEEVKRGNERDQAEG